MNVYMNTENTLLLESYKGAMRWSQNAFAKVLIFFMEEIGPAMHFEYSYTASGNFSGVSEHSNYL